MAAASRRWVRLFGGTAIVLAVVACVSCDLVKPKDRTINSQATPPTLGAFDPATLAPGQHVAGTLSLAIDPLTLQGLSPSWMSLFVDDSLVSTDYGPPYVLEVNTRDWAQGPHDVSLAVFESDPSTGLYGLAGLPSLIQTANVVFDQTPPTSVMLASVGWDNGAALIQWTPNADPNFYSYVINRGGNYRPGDLAPILDRSTVSYRDTSAIEVFGLNLEYRVRVSNRDRTAESNMLALRYGERVPGLTFLTRGRPVTSPTADEFYTLFAEPNYDTLLAVSTGTHTTTKRATAIFGAALAVSRDGAQVMTLHFNTAQLRIYEASTFNLVATRTVPSTISWGTGIAMVAGRAGRAYVGNGSGLFILNTDTGAQVAQVLTVSYPDLAISPDAATLFAATTDSVYRIDVATDAAQVVGRRRSAQPIADIQAGSDGMRVYLGHNYTASVSSVEILDAGSLATLGQVGVPAGEQLFDFLATPSYLYVSHSSHLPGAPYYLPGRVVQYDRSSLAVLRSWDFIQVPSRLVSSRDEQWLYAMGFETWVVPAQSPAPAFARR